MSVVEEKLQEVDGVEFILTTVGSRGFVDSIVAASMFESRKHRRELFRSNDMARPLEGNPMAAWEGNFPQQQKMTEIRTLLSSIPDVRPSVRNLSSLRQGPNVDIDFSVMDRTFEAG